MSKSPKMVLEGVKLYTESDNVGFLKIHTSTSTYEKRHIL